MMSNFAYLGAVNFFPVAPRFDVLHVEYVVGEDFGLLPTMYSRRYYEDVPLNATVTDPVGNAFNVGMVKHEGRVSLTGWGHVGAFYGLHLGGWMKMVYLGPGKFITQVYTNYGDEVVYPPFHPPGPVMELELPANDADHLNEGGAPPVGAQQPAYFRTLTKHLTSDDANQNVLALPVEFGARALPLVSSPVRLVDEDGNQWNCFLNCEMGNGVDVGLTRAWDTFREMKGLKQGDRVKFGVLAPHSDVLYYIPN